MRVLVAGGAGYIGSVVTAALLAERPRGDRARRPLDRARRRRPAGGPLVRGVAARLGAGAGRRPARGGAALRGQEPGRRLPAAARGLLAHQRRRLAGAAGGDAGRRLPADRLLLDRGHLRRAGRRCRSARTRPTRPTNTYGASQARRRPHADLVRGRARLRRGEPALLQRRRRGLRARRAARHRDPPHPDRAAGRGRAAGVADGVRRGLPDARRHLHPRLRARRRPRRRPPAGAAGPGGRRAPDLQPGQRHRLLGAGGRRRRPRGDRAPGAGRGRRAPGRRPGAAGRLQRPHPRRPRLGARAHRPGRHRRATPGTIARRAADVSRRRRPRCGSASPARAGCRRRRRPAAGRCAVRRARAP